MAVQRFSAQAGVDDVTAAMTDDGCAIVEELLDSRTLEKLRAELQPHLDATGNSDDNFLGESTRRVGSIVGRSETAHALVLHPLVHDVCENVITAKNKSMQLHVTQLISIGAGETEQPLHRDQWAWDFFPFPQGHEVMVNCMWALSDFTAENGATRVAPGSHCHEGRELPPDAPIEVAEMTAGSVCLFTGSCFHGGGANTTGTTRDGLILAYCASWLRQEENQYLSVPRDTAAGFDERLQRLIGYDQLYSLGYWGEYRHPLEFLGRESGAEEQPSAD